jgi:hypothetical protein
MQKTLRFLGLVAVIGAFAIVVAQSSPRSKSSDPLASQGGGAVASPNSSGNTNNVLKLMSMYFCNLQQDALDKAEATGRTDRVEPIIQTNCTAMLWISTPEQQRAMVADWQIEKYRGKGTKWDEIARTPSLVKTLLSVSKQVDQKAYDLIEMVWKPIRELDGDFEKQLLASAAWKNAKTKQEKNILHYEGLKAWRVAHPLAPLAERRAATTARYAKAMAETEKLLTPAQRSEFRELRTKFDNALRIAANGDRP